MFYAPDSVEKRLLGHKMSDVPDQVVEQSELVVVERAARANGFLVNAPAPDVLRLVPPLVLTEEQVDAFLAALPTILDAAQRESD